MRIIEALSRLLFFILDPSLMHFEIRDTRTTRRGLGLGSDGKKRRRPQRK